MNILILSPFFPYPLTQGGKIRIFSLIKYLSRSHNITLACISEEKVNDFGPLKDLCKEVLLTYKKPSTAKDLLRFLTGRDPFNYVRYSNGEMKRNLLNFSKVKSFDLVLVEFSMMWQYADIFDGTPVVLDAHNIEAEIIGQIMNTATNPIKRPLYRLEEKRLREKEEESWRNCAACFTVSEKEREVIASHRPSGSVFTVPNGVDLERFKFFPEEGRGNNVLFIAGLDYIPNLDSAEFFLKAIFPIVRSKAAGLKLDVVGRLLWKVQSYATNGVSFHEDVPDVLPFYKSASMLVVPLRHGAGTRIKILEAMAAGLPVVSTSKGCEGLEVINEEHVLIADNPGPFASAVLRLAKDIELRRLLTGNARALVEERYSWEKIVSEMEKHLTSAKLAS